MFNLEGQSVLLTGATGGIGLAIVSVLHQAGATVIASGTNADKLAQLQQQYVDRIHVIQCDLSDAKAVESLLTQAEALTNSIEILVCNAGVCKDNLAIRMKDEEWDAVINLNLNATFKLNRAALKHMMRQRYGRIINISSVVGFTGNFGQANYTAAKAALVGMSKSLALEVATRNITVNCLAPGFIETPMTENLPEEKKAEILKKIPLSRMGTNLDIAAGVLFLAAKESSYITGHTLHINGGMFM